MVWKYAFCLSLSREVWIFWEISWAGISFSDSFLIQILKNSCAGQKYGEKVKGFGTHNSRGWKYLQLGSFANAFYQIVTRSFHREWKLEQGANKSVLGFLKLVRWSDIISPSSWRFVVRDNFAQHFLQICTCALILYEYGRRVTTAQVLIFAPKLITLILKARQANLNTGHEHILKQNSLEC